MKNYPEIYKFNLLIFAALLCFGCVKDVDFNQSEQISLSPDLQSDLLIYSIDERYFTDSITKAFKPVIRDTVRLEFLDDDYIQKDLVSVEFSFRHINTFSQEIDSRILFLSENGQLQFSVDYPIPSGSPNNPSEIIYTEFIEQNRIHLVRNSIQMIVELEMIPNGQPVSGNLDFASKGLFKFEF